MAEYAESPLDQKPKARLSVEQQGDILREARSRWDRAYEKERDNIAAAYEDLDFLANVDDSQWDEKAKKDRCAEGRPVITANQLPQFVHQVTGDIRQMRPAIKVVPVDDQSDEQVAEINAGLIRYIENRSDAAGVYFRAADSQVAAGIGHWRILTEYADNATFNQEIRIADVDDGVAVLWDPDSKRATREDGQFCFVPVDFSSDGFKDKYPNADTSGFDTLKSWTNISYWYTDDHVRVAEYWVKEPIERLLALTPDGKIIDLTGANAGQMGIFPPGTRFEKRNSYRVVRYLITGCQVLEGPEEWPGRHIPIVPVVGEEIRVGRKTIRKGIVRDAKGPQRMFNYFCATHTEVVALQPKAPFMLTEENVAKYQDMWQTANHKNWPYLIYSPDSHNGGKEPTRVQPPVSSQGVTEGIAIANENLRRVIGIYDASLGAQSNETSGKAILARQREGDTGTYVFIDNFSRAIRRTGEILIDLIPKIYDTERTIRIMGEDGKIDILRINQTRLEASDEGFAERTLNDVTAGSYDVVTQVGPSYSTKREEAKEGMVEFVRAAPEAGGLILDLLAKAQDWPMSDDIAKRFRANLPPQILKMEELEKQGATPEQIAQFMEEQRQNQPPPPEVMEAQAKMEMEGQRLQMDQAKAQRDAQLAQLKLEMDQAAMEAKIALERENAERQAQIEIEKIREAARQAQAKLEAEIMLEREKIASQQQVAMRSAELNAQTKVHDAQVRAETAKYATDNRPEPAKGK